MHRIFKLLLLLIIYGCNNSSPEGFGLITSENCECQADHPLISFEVVKRYHLPVTDIPYDYEMSRVIVTENGKKEYWGFDDFQSAFYRFDIEQEAFIDSIPISDTGPDNLSPVKDFFPINPDSILLHSNERRKLRLIDGSGNLLKAWSFNRPLPSDRPGELYYFITFPDAYTRLTYLQNKKAVVFHPLYYIEGATRPYPREHYELPCFINFYPEEDRYGPAYGAYPPSYQQEEYSSYEMFLPFCTFEDQVVASFQKSHCLYWAEESQPTIKTCARSRFLPDQFEFLPVGTSSSLRVKNYKTNGAYITVLSDPYRRLLYRVVSHAQDPPLDINAVVKNKERARWSVMVIDADSGRCLGEAVFEEEQYDFFDIWVLPEGLLISEENPYRADNQEEFLSFTLVRFED